MYRLMKCEKVFLGQATAGPASPYRQTQVESYPQLRVAMAACQAANDEGRSRHYLLNESGKEYYSGIWID